MGQIRIDSMLLVLLAVGSVPVRASQETPHGVTTNATSAEFKRQTITIASDQGWWMTSYLTDVDGDGLTDLLALLPAQHELRVYRQRPSGFAATPDQTVALPDRTAWIAMRDVDPHKGKELVLSTATGVVYHRQNDGAFEPSPQTLLEARQVFTADRLRLAPGAPGGQDANERIPILGEDRATWYEQDADYAWHAAETVSLSPTATTWNVYEEYWMTGPAPAFSLEVRRTVRPPAQDSRTRERDAEKKAVQELLGKITQGARRRNYGVVHQDVNGDGREDVVLWRARGDISPNVMILLLLRGPDGKLPAQPTRVLRHSGLPIRVNRKLGVSPFWDLDGDGRCELILVALKTRVTSWSGLVNMVVSGGVEWIFTVRSGRDGTYSGGPDFRMDVTSTTPRDGTVFRFFRLDGDFNGDRRVDLLVERGLEQFDVYRSAPQGGFFQAGPSLSFAAPTEARVVSTADLNGDGLSDLFVQAMVEARLTIYLSQSDPRKGTPQ
jgi:hypothetical protein